MKTLNLVMIVKNESRCLSRCLELAKPLVDAIIIVDTGSSDNTREIARSFGAAVYDFTWNQDFSAARNYSLSLSDSDWNLVLDADEYLQSGTRACLLPYLETPDHLGVIRRIDSFTDSEGVSQSTTLAARLLPRGVTFCGRIHEQAQSDLPRIMIPLTFEHDGYQNLGEEKGRRNLALLLEALKEDPRDPYYLFQAAVTLANLKRHEEAAPYFCSFYRQVPHDANYRTAGIVAGIYNALATGNIGELLPLVLRETPELSCYSDFMFVCGLFFTKLVLSDIQNYLPYLGQIEACYLTCLEIGEHPEHQGTVGTGSFKAAHNLGAWYEVSGDLEKAKYYYEKAAESGYAPAVKRLRLL